MRSDRLLQRLLLLPLRRLAAPLSRRRLRDENSGSVLPIVALAGFVLVGAIGLAIDTSQLVMTHSRLQNAVDAAGLSAASKFSTSSVGPQIQKFADANFLASGTGATITSLTYTVSADNSTINVAATAQAPTTFFRIFGIDQWTTSVKSQVLRATGGMELSLILDVTGSMGDNNKLGDLKTASKNLLDTLFGDGAVPSKLYVGIVPFSQSVNIGTSHQSWLTAKNGSWSGCVQPRFDGKDTTDDPPTGNGKFTQYGNTCPPAITPMTSTKATLVNAINALKANGNTHVGLGAVWGWRMLSPNWRNYWGGEMDSNKLPLDYATKGITKAAVIMTDGENTYSASDEGSSYGGYTCDSFKNNKSLCHTDSRLDVSYTRTQTCYFFGCYANDSGLNQMVQDAQDKLDARLSDVCTKMKNAGITVYTIALGNPGDTIENRLKACASQSAFFFDSPTGADLKVAFANIGDSLSNLRVSN